jgi:hypothetical protein
MCADPKRVAPRTGAGHNNGPSGLAPAYCSRQSDALWFSHWCCPPIHLRPCKCDIGAVSAFHRSTDQRWIHIHIRRRSSRRPRSPNILSNRRYSRRNGLGQPLVASFAVSFAPAARCAQLDRTSASATGGHTLLPQQLTCTFLVKGCHVQSSPFSFQTPSIT